MNRCGFQKLRRNGTPRHKLYQLANATVGGGGKEREGRGGAGAKENSDRKSEQDRGPSSNAQSQTNMKPENRRHRQQATGSSRQSTESRQLRYYFLMVYMPVLLVNV
jgi:hypothetical protein